jgi:hypothetical protein
VVPTEGAAGLSEDGGILILLLDQVPIEPPSDLLDEVLSGVTIRARHVPGSLAIPESVVHGLAKGNRPGHDAVIVLLCRRVGVKFELGSVLHGADHGLNETKGVEGGLLPAEVGVPKVGDGTMGGFVLLNHGSVVPLSDEVGGDETWGTVNLGDLIGQHVTVVIVGGHTEVSTGPSNDLHGGSVGNEMLKFPAGVVEKALGSKRLLVVLVKHLRRAKRVR